MTARARLRLDHGWNDRPWLRDPRPATALDLETTVRIPLERRSEVADLLLEGLWWRATITVDGERLPPVTGGAAPLRVPLGAHLADGEATISIHITAPEAADSTVLSGGELIRSQGKNRGWPWLASAPVLELHPRRQLRSTTLRAEADGRVTPMAWVEGGYVGQEIRFRATLDGALVQELGAARLAANGEAVGDPRPWTGPRWSPADPALILLEASLLDAEGSLLDQRADRTGVRHLTSSEAGLVFDGAPLRLHALRVDYTPAPPSLAEQLSPFLGGGWNGVEMHGDMVPAAWMEQADELGLLVSRVPRCAGLAGQAGPLPATLQGELHASDLRFIEANLHHPSLVMWVDEHGPGGPGAAAHRLASDTLFADPQPRAYVPRDREELAYDAKRDELPCAGRACAGLYVIEVHPDVGVSWASVARGWQSALEAGVWGGVIPRPPSDHIPSWRAAFAPMLEAAGVAPWPRGERRASARVEVNGLPAGQIAWLELPGQPTLGAVADPAGAATFEAWHEGSATLRWGEERRELRLLPRRWTDTSLSGAPTPVSADGP
jgi:hypothetical protein